MGGKPYFGLALECWLSSRLRSFPRRPLYAAVGGFNSGRRGGRPTIDGGPTLDLYHLIRRGLFNPGHYSTGSIFWTRVRTGERLATIGYEAYMGGGAGHVRLRYTTTTYDGEKRASDYSIALVTTPQPFGGRRWWFRCPKSGDLVGKLHLPDGADTFASRRAHRLGYCSQRETPSDRATSRAFKLRKRLGGKGAIGGHVPKPKWMRWSTYAREIARIKAAEDIVDAHMLAFLEKPRRKKARLGVLTS